MAPRRLRRAGESIVEFDAIEYDAAPASASTELGKLMGLAASAQAEGTPASASRRKPAAEAATVLPPWPQAVPQRQPAAPRGRVSKGLASAR
jgi:hypothetical protein